MVELVPQCAGVLNLAQKMKSTQVPQLVENAEQMVRNAYDWAVEERDRWTSAGEKVEECIKALGSNPQLTELRRLMSDAAACWEDCAREYSSFLES